MNKISKTVLTFRFSQTAFCAIALATALGQAALAQQSTPTSQPESRPMARPMGTFKDFGKVTEGETVTHTFQIVNVGPVPLQITNVAADCTCTKADHYPEVIGPGVVGDFAISVATKGMLGPMVKHLNVATNDPATPNITFTINAEVRRLIEIMPPSAGFGRVMDNEVRQQTVTLTNRANIPMQATLKEPTKSGNFEAELVETIPGFEIAGFGRLLE